jgi:hypothetical protein
MGEYQRKCPRCQVSFKAVSECGVCPACGLFSRVCQNGQLVVLVDVEPQDSLPHDDPFRNTPLAVLFEFLDSGGGPITTAERYAGMPLSAEVHRQLRIRFDWLRALLFEHEIETEVDEIELPESHPDWIGTSFADAERLFTMRWFIPLEREKTDNQKLHGSGWRRI